MNPAAAFASKKELLGEGSYGKVYLIQDKITKKKYALKEVEVPKKNVNFRILNEINVLSYVKSDYLISLEKKIIFDDHSMNFVIPLMHGDLFDLCEHKIPIDKLRSVFFKVAVGIYHLHSASYIHGDVKLENILYKNNGHDIEVKIADFGMVERTFPNNLPVKLLYSVFTTNYRPPEVYKGYVTEKSDVFALGITYLYFIAQATLEKKPNPEFNGDKMTDVQKQIYAGKYSGIKTIIEEFEDKENVGILTELITAMVQREENKRIDVYQVLAHRFFEGMQVDNVSSTTVGGEIKNKLTPEEIVELEAFVDQNLDKKWVHIFGAFDLYRRLPHNYSMNIGECYNVISGIYDHKEKILPMSSVFFNLVDAINGLFIRRYFINIIRTAHDVIYLIPFLFSDEYFDIKREFQDTLPSVRRRLNRNINYDSTIQECYELVLKGM